MKQYYLAFHLLSRYTNVRFLKILKGCRGDLVYAWERAGQLELIDWGIEEEIAGKIVYDKKTIDPAQEYERLLQKNITMLLMGDREYPLLLKEISDPPLMLYLRGNADTLSIPAVAFVGTRLMTAYGKQVLEHLLFPLIQSGVAIVSGLAVGVDAHAHSLTLAHNGRTVAVLGSGLDAIYPVHNRKLAAEIIQNNGTVVSEFPPAMKPTPYTFPIRNRIISGLSKGVVIVEAKEKSGSLITARLALEQNRDVFAIPGSIFLSNSAGTHNLIKNGEAKLVTSGEDILIELGFQKDTAVSQDMRAIRFDTKNEELLYALLSSEPQLLDHIVEKSNFPPSRVGSLLTLLEMKALAHNIGGNRWVRQ